MAPRCSVCSHVDHLNIDAHILGAGVPRLSHRELAARYGLSRASVQRHASSHIAPIMRAVQDQAQTLHAESMLSELGSLYERSMRLLDRAEAAGDLRTAVAALRELRSTVETFAKVGLAMSREPEVIEDVRSDLDERIESALRNRANASIASLPSGDDDVCEAEVVDE